MPTPIKKQFDYYITNLDWGDGSDLEFIDKPKLFDRSFNFEHTYTMPGFYTIRGLVFKYSLLMKNLFPPPTIDHNPYWEVVEADTSDEDDAYPSIYKFVKTIVEEEQYIRLGGFNVSEDPNALEGPAIDGIQFSPSSRIAYQITKPNNSATTITIFTGLVDGNDVNHLYGQSEEEFRNTIMVRVGSSGGNATENTVEELYNQLYVANHTRKSGARFNVNVHMDADNNSLFRYKFDAWLPNFGRFSETPPSDIPNSEYNPPSESPSGYLANTSGNAQSIETQPPNRQSQVQATYELEFADLGLGTTTEYWNGEGAWIITDSTGGNDPIFTWSPNLNNIQQYTRNGAVSDDGLWQWVYTEDSGEWVWSPNPNPFLSDDEQWIYDGTQWVDNPNFVPEIARDPVNNPTRYTIKIRAIEPNYDDDGNEIYNSPDWGTGQDTYDYISGTNSWQTYDGSFYSTKRYVRLYFEIVQRDIDKDFPPVPSGYPTDILANYGTPPWSFYIRNIEANFQNNSDLKFPLEWEKFNSNMIINSSDNYASPMYEKNNFLMIGGLSKKSFHFKSLLSLLGYNSDTLEPKENFEYAEYNPYDVVTGLDTLAKYDSSLYNEYLNPYAVEIQNQNTDEVINTGMVDKKWHGTFEESFLTDVDVSTTKIFRGVKPMWQQLGFDDEDFDNPNRIFYWNNIHTGEKNDRDGITQRNLPDPKRGALTPRVPRKEYVVAENSTQYWRQGNYWPSLPKYNKLGVFSDQYPPGQSSETFYGNEISSITTTSDSDPNLLFELNMEDDILLDGVDKHIINLTTDFSLYVNENKRIVKKITDFTDPIEVDSEKQAF